jgi:flagellar motility protein MotE (MotC chaperone)
MTDKIFRWFAAFCVATILFQLVLLSYLATRGTLNGPTVTKVVALANGIDITGNRLEEILRRDQHLEQPDFDEILEARKLEGLDMDMQRRSLLALKDDITGEWAETKQERERLDERLQSFDKKEKDTLALAQQEGVKQVQRTLQTLDAAQAKDQLLKIYDDERIDEVVNIIQAMPTDKRKDILGEFVTPEEADKLHEILSLIGSGGQTTTAGTGESAP